MLGLNYLAWIGIVSWIVVPLLGLFTTALLWRRSRAGLSKGLALVAGVAILSVPTLISNGVKAQYDRQVRELCAKDGGVRVYETVRLPAEKFDQLGQIRIPSKQDAKPGDEYYDDWRVQHYKEGNPSIRRDHFLVYRRADMKLLGEAISYARLGGDLPGPWHGSSFRCPKQSGDSILYQRIFIQSKGE